MWALVTEYGRQIGYCGMVFVELVSGDQMLSHISLVPMPNLCVSQLIFINNEDFSIHSLQIHSFAQIIP